MFRIMIEIICMKTFKLPCFERLYILSHCCIDACCSISPLQSLAIFEMRSHAYGGEEQMKAEAERKSRIQSSKICGFSRPIRWPRRSKKNRVSGMPFKKGVSSVSPKNGKTFMSPGCHTGYSHSLPPPSIPMPSESKSVFRIRQARITSLRLLGSLLAKRPTKCAAFQEAWWRCHRWSPKSHTQKFHTMYITSYIYI